MEHVNELELQCARKHRWTPRQFFYALRTTITGAARQTWAALERDEDQPDLADFIPEWFECEQSEYKDLLKKRALFSHLSERTQIAIIFVYFFYRFQRDTPRTALDNFIYAVQEATESVEQWGYRLERLVTKLISFGISISFEEYLQQWQTGTKDKTFSWKLQEALQSDDPTRAPIIYDYPSFKVWYSRYIGKLVEKKKLLARKSTLLTMNRMRKASGGKNTPGDNPRPRSKNPGKGNNKTPGEPSKTRFGNHISSFTPRSGKKDDDHQRTGPAPPGNRNVHSRLFRPGPDAIKNKRCFNCDELGHLAKDCPKPKRPRRMRPRWRNKVQSLVSELTSSLDPAHPDSEQLSHQWQGAISAFMSSVTADESDGPTEEDEGHSEHNSPDVASEPTTDQPDADADEDAASEVQPEGDPAQSYAYNAFRIGAYASRLSVPLGHTSSVGGPSRHEAAHATSSAGRATVTTPGTSGTLHPGADFPDVHYFSITDLWHHDWPMQMHQWLQHCVRHLIPCLHRLYRREGYEQCEIELKELYVILWVTTWLYSYTNSPLARSFLELLDLAMEAKSLTREALVEQLQEFANMGEVSEILPENQLYTRMVEAFRTMSSEAFYMELDQLFHTADVSGSEGISDTDPTCSGGGEWAIPGPGEDFPVSWEAEGDSAMSRRSIGTPGRDKKVNSRMSQPGSQLDSIRTPGRNSEVGPRTPKPGLQIEPKKPDPELGKELVTTPETSRGVTTPGALSRDPGSYTYAVLKIKHYPVRDEHRFVIWASRAATVRLKGVKLVKTCERLHVAKNHIQQSVRSRTSTITERVPKDVILFDPHYRTSAEETKGMTVVRYANLSFDIWVSSLDDVSARLAPKPSEVATEPSSQTESSELAGVSHSSETDSSPKTIDSSDPAHVEADEKTREGEEDPETLAETSMCPYRLQVVNIKTVRRKDPGNAVLACIVAPH